MWWFVFKKTLRWMTETLCWSLKTKSVNYPKFYFGTVLLGECKKIYFKVWWFVVNNLAVDTEMSSILKRGLFVFEERRFNSGSINCILTSSRKHMRLFLKSVTYTFHFVASTFSTRRKYYKYKRKYVRSP